MTVGALLLCASLLVFGQTDGEKTVLVAAILGVVAMLVLVGCTIALALGRRRPQKSRGAGVREA
jgi:hypothetical protein